MDPRVWGRCLWKSLIYIASEYPDPPTSEDQSNYSRFFQSLGPVLPCPTCRVNYLKHYSELPIMLSSRQSLLNWLHQLYNLTLKDQGRSDISYDFFIKKHLHPSPVVTAQDYLQSSLQGSPIITILTIILFSLVIYYFYRGRLPSIPFPRLLTFR